MSVEELTAAGRLTGNLGGVNVAECRTGAVADVLTEYVGWLIVAGWVDAVYGQVVNSGYGALVGWLTMCRGEKTVVEEYAMEIVISACPRLPLCSAGRR